MARFPSHLGRVSTLMQSQQALSSITRTNLELLRVREQISTGLAVSRVSDDPVRAATVLTLDDQIERSAQRLRNLSHAGAALGALDTALGDANDLALEAKDIASRQLSFGASAGERAGQAVVVGQMLQSLFQITRRTGVAGHLFGASQPSLPPVEEFRGGYRLVARGDGLLTDTGLASGIPITLGVGSAVGALSARMKGSVDLNPNLTRDTRLADLTGGRGAPIALGPVEFAFGSGPRAGVDLTGADTVGNVVDRLAAAIRQYETDNGVTVLGPGGVSFSGGRLSIDVVPGTPPPELRFFDIGSAVTAKDLGLTSEPPTAFTAASPLGADLGPRLTWLTPVVQLAGVTGTLGSIRISNAGASKVMDLSGAQTLGDIKRLIESADLGVRVELNAAGNAIDVINEVSAGAAGAMSIEEVAGNNSTATRLGLRTLAADTPLSVFNQGRGVQVIDGRTNPLTGLPDPTLNTDMTITLGDGRSFTIDLRPQDVTSVQTVIARINAQAAVAGIAPADFTAGLVDGANGIALMQNAAFPGALGVRSENNSTAAEQLGLLSGVWDGANARWMGQDRARVRVDSLFSHLIDLRENLLANHTSGISLAGEGIDRSARSLGETRGLVGALAQRVDFAAEREQDVETLNQTVRSQLRDTDFASAASRFALLQTQLEAGLRVTSQAGSLSLLNFLG
jgi:flagellin-like hook-associated protein FlgL